MLQIKCIKTWQRKSQSRLKQTPVPWFSSFWFLGNLIHTEHTKNTPTMIHTHTHADTVNAHAHRTQSASMAVAIKNA